MQNDASKFSSATIATDTELNPSSLSTLVPTKSLFTLAVSELKNKTFEIIERLIDRNDDINDVVVNNPEHDASLRNRVRFVLRSSDTSPRVSLSVRQILSLKTTDAKNGTRTVADLIYQGKLNALPLKIKFTKVTARTVDIGDNTFPVYPYHLYDAFVNKQESLKKAHSLVSPDTEFNFGELYQDRAFLATLHGTAVVEHAKDSDVLKDVLIKVVD